MECSEDNGKLAEVVSLGRTSKKNFRVYPFTLSFLLLCQSFKYSLEKWDCIGKKKVKEMIQGKTYSLAPKIWVQSNLS